MLNVIYLVCKPQVQGQGSQLIITCNDTMNTSNTFIHLLMDFFSQITSQTRWHFEAKQQNVGAVCCLCSEMWSAKYRSWSITCLADDGVLHIYLLCQSNHCDVTVPGAEALTLLFIAACLHKLCILWSYCSVLERKRASLLPEQFVRRQATSGTSWEMCADHTCYRTWSVQACTINTIIQ